MTKVDKTKIDKTKVEQYLDEWFEFANSRYEIYKKGYIKNKKYYDKAHKLVIGIFIKYRVELPNNERMQKLWDKLNEKENLLQTKKNKLDDNEVGLDKDFIDTYTALEYLEDVIEDDRDLKSLIFLILDIVNSYAVRNKRRERFNESINKQKEKRKLKQQLAPIEKILEDIKRKLGFIYEYEDNKLLEKELKAYKDRLIKKSYSRHNDTDYYREKLRKFMLQAYSTFKIEGHKKELDDLIKGLRPSVFN